MENFGKRLRIVFDNRQNSDIAKLLKVSDPTVTNYMNGRVPNAETLIEISNLTRCNLHWLLTGIGDVFLDNHKTAPQNLVILSQKGGAGATSASVFIATVLAGKGFRVLFLGEENSQGQLSLIPDNPLKKRFGSKFSRSKFNYFFKSEIPNLDVLIYKNQLYFDYMKDRLEIFEQSKKQIADGYDFIVIDGGKVTFFDKMLQNKMLQDVFSLDTSKVLLSYQLRNSRLDDFDIVKEYIELKNLHDSNIEFIGTFINNFSGSLKTKLNLQLLQEIKDAPESKLLKEIIKHNENSLEDFIKTCNVEKLKKTSLYKNYSNLTNEILDKL